MLHRENIFVGLSEGHLLVVLDQQHVVQFIYHPHFSISGDQPSKGPPMDVSLPRKQEHWESEHRSRQRVQAETSVAPVIPVHPVHGELLQHTDTVSGEYTIQCLLWSYHFVPVAETVGAFESSRTVLLVETRTVGRLLEGSAGFLW